MVPRNEDAVKVAPATKLATIPAPADGEMKASNLRDPGPVMPKRAQCILPLSHELWHEYDDMARPPARSGKRHGERKPKRPPAPLTSERLEELALAYAARFATTAAKLRDYLRRKLRERGFDAAEEGAEPDIDALVEKFVDRGYVDDEVYARARSGDLLRRGYGARRVNEALHSAGIDETLREDFAPDEAAARDAIVALARKRRFGPFDIAAPEKVSGGGAFDDGARKRREKQLAALIRAGHGFDHARIVLDARSEAELEEWAREAREHDWN